MVDYFELNFQNPIGLLPGSGEIVTGPLDVEFFQKFQAKMSAQITVWMDNQKDNNFKNFILIYPSISY